MDSRASRASLVDGVLGAVQEGTSVLLTGLPGSGRSRLLALLRDAALRTDRRVLSVPGVGTGAGRPLESLVLAGAIDPAPAQPVSLGRALDAVERALGSGPAVVLLDDADALDETSAAVLAAASARRDVPVVAAQRPPSPATVVETVLGGRPTTALTMPALAFEDVHGATSSLLGGDVDAGVAGRIYGLSGGLPGLVRSIATGARRAGHLVEESGTWVARRDLVTRGLEVDVRRLLAGLSPEQHDAVRILAAVGTAELPTARRLLAWPVLVALDDHGLLRFVETDGRTGVTLYPPLVGELLRQTAGARALHADAQIADALASDHDTWDPLGRPAAPELPTGWAASRESAAILGRELRRHTAAQLLARRDAWERRPSTRNTVEYLDALALDEAPAAVIEAVLERTHEVVPEEPIGSDFLLAWEAVYRGVVRHERATALALLRTGPVEDESSAVRHAVAQHILLTTGDARDEERAVVPDLLLAGEHDGERPPPQGDELVFTADAVVRLVRSEVLLAQGRTDDARDELVDLPLPEQAQRQDATSWRSLAVLCGGEVRSAVEQSHRLLDQARDRFDPTQIEPHGYVVALGLFVEGRLSTLREHLTSMFAAGTPAPLRPTTRAGLLCLGGALSLLEGNVASARSLARQLEGLRLLAASAPLARPYPLVAQLTVGTGAEDPEEATRTAWDVVDAMDRRGYFLAAVFDAVWLVILWPDAERCRRLADHAAAAQGDLLPALGRYLRAAADRSPAALVSVADDLRSRGLHLPATQAHAMAVRLLREDDRPAQASEEAHRLHAHVARAGEELELLVPSVAPADALSPREREVARLVARGLSNRDVARQLVVSDRTVDNHVYRIFRKLGITSRDQLSALL